MVHGGDERSGYGPAQPGEAPFDPEATQVVYGGPSPYAAPPAQPSYAPPLGQPAPYAPPPGPGSPYGPPPVAGNPTTAMPAYGVPSAYGPPGAPGYGPSRYGELPPEPPRKRRGALLAVAAGVTLLLLLAVGGVGIALLTDEPKAETPALSSPTPTPSAPAQSPSTPPSASDSSSEPGSPLTDISSRATDPKPLTTAELFPEPTIVFNGTGYRVLGRKAVTNCRTAADGKLATAIMVSGCSQVVRATVAHPGGQYLVTVGVVNLPSQAAADQIYRLLDDPGRNGYFKRLNGTGIARNFEENRDTVVGSLARGHYVIFAVGGRAGSTSASLADEELKATLKDMRLYTNEAITKRSLG